MEQQYCLARSQEELGAAVNAACPEARRIHLDLARRYGLEAGDAVNETMAGSAYEIGDTLQLRYVA